MKRVLLLVCFALLPVSFPALAKDGKACEAESAKLPTAERDAHMKKCLAQLGDPANVKQTQQQDKQARCEQNAKNQQLQGGDKSSYVSSCISNNEAADAAKASAAGQPAPAKQAAAPKAKHASAKSTPTGAKSCSAQAKEKGLKGKDRKEFMKTCQKG
jgi:hypothetical protein